MQLHGFRQYDELPAYYGLADAFVHASTAEQWGLVVNEAMAAGLPVIVSQESGCARDLVQAGRNGFTFPARDLNALTQRLQDVASDSCDRLAMGAESREIIRQWSPETFARGLCQAAEVAESSPLTKSDRMGQAALRIAMVL